MIRIVLLSTYDLGHQPFGLASPAAWLRQAGASVSCQDLSIQELDEEAVRHADLVAFFLPMHTATRLAIPAARRVKALNPAVHLCFYGLYAALNEGYLRELGAETILSGEYEHGLRDLALRLAGAAVPDGAAPPPPEVISLARQSFRVPDRQGLPGLDRYAHLHMGEGRPRRVGYTQASRGCKHTCRHCPIVPVYGGRFRVVAQEVVLEDIRRQVTAGAEHITFGDPDFFNGPGHVLPMVRQLHDEFPALTYDVTIKVEHLLRHARYLPLLQETGCLLVTSAVEAFDDRVLDFLQKGHNRADFYRALALCRSAGLVLQPTFLAFHPWTTLRSYREMLDTLEELDLVEQVAPIQLGIRLLLTAGSLLLNHPEIRALAGPFDPQALVYPWKHPDPQVDALQRQVQRAVEESTARREDRVAIFQLVSDLAGRRPAGATGTLGQTSEWDLRAPIPYLTEPWYC